ncbi:MAG: SDR family NAD(P)-dependent oxidoreductase [bacterium]
MRLEGRSAIITGAGRGIGKATATKFLKEGARVLVCDIVGDRMEASGQDLSHHGEVHTMVGDVSDPGFCDALLEQAQGVFGELNILANIAGIAVWQPFLKHSEAAWDRTLNVNLKSVFMLSQRAARVMIEQGEGGAIVSMASTNGHVGEKCLAAYNASKAGVVLLTKTMAIELAPHNIRVNCVAGGFIQTKLAANGDVPDDFLRDYIKKIPLGRPGRPEEVANLITFLASDEASFITGESVVIDGGQLSEE